MERHFLWLSAAAHAALTALLFWRYAFSPATTVSDPGDPLLNIWIMEWVERALTHFPTELFNAPMFHPFKGTLAYSDPLIPQALVALPLRAIGFGPIFAYNFVFLGGIVVAGVLATQLFFELSGDRAAALVGAVVATFPAARLYHLAHMQLQVTAFWPMVLLLIHRVTRRLTGRSAALLALSLAAAPLASPYHGLFMAVLLPPFVVVLWMTTWPTAKAATLIGMSVLGAALLLVPFARVYARSIAEIAQPRDVRAYSNLMDYFGVSPFTDLSKILPSVFVVRDATPQWIGGGAALLLPLCFLYAAVVLIRRRTRLPDWLRALLPYAVLGSLSVLLSFPARLSWAGHALLPNPVALVTGLPGAREIRELQRTGFVSAFAAGAVLSIVLAEARRRRRYVLVRVGYAWSLASTFAGSFSTSLPGFAPTPVERLAPVYLWLAEQPDSMVIYEVPEPPLREKTAEFLWAAVHHRKRLIHGYSGFLPLTDVTLRGEPLGVARPDFSRALARLGGTHLVVHTDRLSALPGGVVSLERLRVLAHSRLVAAFPDADVYALPELTAAERETVALSEQRPLLTTGGATGNVGDCVQVGRDLPPFEVFLPPGGEIVGLVFSANAAMSDIDDTLLIERSREGTDWRPAEHDGLLSSSLAAYVQAPTRRLRIRAMIAATTEPFVRVSSNRRLPFRICEFRIGVPSGSSAARAIPQRELRVRAQPRPEVSFLAADGDVTTGWQSAAAQEGKEAVELDLNEPSEVTAVVLAPGPAHNGFGRKLALDCKRDGTGDFEGGPEIDGAEILFETPRVSQVLALAPPRACRALRIRQTGVADEPWSLAEVTVYVRGAPPGVLQ